MARVEEGNRKRDRDSQEWSWPGAWGGGRSFRDLWLDKVR